MSKAPTLPPASEVSLLDRTGTPGLDGLYVGGVLDLLHGLFRHLVVFELTTQANQLG